MLKKTTVYMYNMLITCLNDAFVEFTIKVNQILEEDY